MKKFILVMLAVCLASLAKAQESKIIDDKLDHAVLKVKLNGADMSSLEMQQELSLSQEQYDKVVKLNLERYKQLNEAEQLYKHDDMLLSKTMYSINLEADKQIGTMLDPKQLRQFLELENRHQGRLVSDNAEK